MDKSGAERASQRQEGDMRAEPGHVACRREEPGLGLFSEWDGKAAEFPAARLDLHFSGVTGSRQGGD